jgi:hypothetical protein
MTVPYRAIRLVAGAVTLVACVFVLVSHAAVVPTAFALALFAAGWYVARRYAHPATGATQWLDAVLPFGIALFVALPGVLGPFLGQMDATVGFATVLPLFAAMSLAIAFGPYADQKVALTR